MYPPISFCGSGLAHMRQSCRLRYPPAHAAYPGPRRRATRLQRRLRCPHAGSISSAARPLRAAGRRPFGPRRRCWSGWTASRVERPPWPCCWTAAAEQMTSEAFAAWLGARRDEGAQHIVFAIGPASGWSDAARGRAQLLLSLGPVYAGPRAGPPGDGRAALPGIYNSDWTPLPQRPLSCSLPFRNPCGQDAATDNCTLRMDSE